MLCPQCDGVMEASSNPFDKKVNGEKKTMITYVCFSCGFTDDYPAKKIKSDKYS